jgi:protoporphyrinogen oxidase
MYAARKTGLKKEMFGYVTGGYDVINRALEAKLKSMGISLIVNASANRVFKEDSGKIRVETTGGDSYLFDTVISTLPSDISVQIAPSLSVEEIEKHMAIKYLGIFCPSVLIRNPISKYYVTNIIDSWPPFTGIIEMTSLVDPKELNNRTLIYLPKYVDPHSELFNMRDEELNSHFLNGLLKMYPGLSEDEIIHFDTSSSKRVFALPTLRYSEKLPPITTSLQGYYIVNSAQIINSTHNVNEIIQVAEIKLEEILNSFSDN